MGMTWFVGAVEVGRPGDCLRMCWIQVDRIWVDDWMWKEGPGLAPGFPAVVTGSVEMPLLMGAGGTNGSGAQLAACSVGGIHCFTRAGAKDTQLWAGGLAQWAISAES